MDKPDFDKTAVIIAANLATDTASPRALSYESQEGYNHVVASIREALRATWNARGAADAKAVDARIRELVAGEVVGAGVARHVGEAVRALDA